MNTVMTVKGPVDGKSLGFCQCHEHLMLSKGVSYEKSPVLLIDDLEKSTGEALRLVKHGGGTIVDAQPGGCNRMAEALLEISQRTGLHIIASTGFHKLYFYPQNHWLYTKSEEELEAVFLHELTRGMYTDIDRHFHEETMPSKAGIVKMALDKEGLTPVYQKLFWAGAGAAIKAAVPVMLHIEQDADALALFHFLKEADVKPCHMIFCHMDRAVANLSVHKQLLKEGVFLEYDTIGRFKYHSDAREIEIFTSMLHEGYEDQILFSLDTTRARLKTYDPDAVGLDYLLTTFIPFMKENGITSEQINKISHANFVRVFTQGYQQQ